MNDQLIYGKYELLLPSKFDGGFLIIALYEKIKSREIDEHFSQKEINEILKDISTEFNQESVRQWGNIKDNLFHYFLRSHPDEPWKYYLTDYAKNVVDLMISKLENPYKNHPLKKSVQDSFTIRHNEINTIEELERKFGRIFTLGSKKIITDHLESLEDELREAYKQLNEILRKDENSATALVREFTIVFRKFGERAEDITEAIISKDKFLTDLQTLVDRFYTKMENDSSFNNTDVSKSIVDWEKAQEIYTDIRSFFNSVDNKVSLIRRQIINASEKLTELQEQFSLRSHFRIQIKKLHIAALESSSYTENGIELWANFPLKSLVHERTRILYPGHHEFDVKRPNIIISILEDENYKRQEKQKIEKEINRQQIINKWVDKAKEILEKNLQISVDELMNTVCQEDDLSIAYQVASQMLAFAAENRDAIINVEHKIISLKHQNMSLWKTKIMK